MESKNFKKFYFNTDDVNIEAVNFLLRELKLRRDDDRTKVYEIYWIILSKDEDKIRDKISELKNLLSKNSNNFSSIHFIYYGKFSYKEFERSKISLIIMNNLTLNIKYYSDYERGFLIMTYLFMITGNLKNQKKLYKKYLL